MVPSLPLPAGSVDEMIVGEGPPEPQFDDGEAVDREGMSIEIGPITLPVEPGSLVHDVQGVAVGEPVPGGGGPVAVNMYDLLHAGIEIADEPHEEPKPRPVRYSQP